MKPDYSKIYRDLTTNKYPDRFSNQELDKLVSNINSSWDVIYLNNYICSLKDKNNSKIN